MNRDNNHIERIAFGLISSREPKARRKLMRTSIDAVHLPLCSINELKLLNFLDPEIQLIKNYYRETGEEELEKSKKNNVDIIFREDECYPPLLSEIDDPPDFIYSMGNKEILKKTKIAVVGSRKASSYGWNCLNAILPQLCEVGLAVVSGMAYGIDSMAHKVALREEGSTIGVNAGGLLHLYPAGNIALVRQVIEKGCVISEFSLDTIPRPFYFPIRNRIIAGVSKGILVVEAALKSGSLITARLGLEQNRDIFAIPGRIDSPISEGTNYLIQQGAKLVASPRDILPEFGIILAKPTKDEKFAFSQDEEAILAVMADNDIKTVDYFVEKLDYPVSMIISLLMGLILKNIIIEESGGYRRIKF